MEEQLLPNGGLTKCGRFSQRNGDEDVGRGSSLILLPRAVERHRGCGLRYYSDRPALNAREDEHEYAD